MVLPDVLQPNLKVVFCGSAVGPRSAEVGAYYAGRGNQFWSVLFRLGLTPRKLDPSEFAILPKYGIGLTDIVKNRSGLDADLISSDSDAAGLRSKIERFAPRALAFNGKRAAQEFYGYAVDRGRQPQQIESTAVFVLPSTSGAARGHWDEKYWTDLAEFILDSA